MLVFGLTGGIASGKSTVSARLRELGVVVIDADEIAREVAAKGTEGLEEIIKVFGQEVLTAEGDLDRAKMGTLVFQDAAQRQRLNSILHPRIGTRTALRMEEARNGGAELVAYDAALLCENGLADAFRPLVIVSATEEQQIARAMARNGWSETEARARVAAQMPLMEKVKLADRVIDNTGGLENTMEQVDALVAALKSGPGLERRVP